MKNLMLSHRICFGPRENWHGTAQDSKFGIHGHAKFLFGS